MRISTLATQIYPKSRLKRRRGFGLVRDRTSWQVPAKPIFGIRTEVRPLSMIGEQQFSDTAVAVDILLEASDGTACVAAISAAAALPCCRRRPRVHSTPHMEAFVGHKTSPVCVCLTTLATFAYRLSYRRVLRQRSCSFPPPSAGYTFNRGRGTHAPSPRLWQLYWRQLPRPPPGPSKLHPGLCGARS